ncbi:MAG: phosphate acyltransferase PlsX [Nitrospinota bacterium]
MIAVDAMGGDYAPQTIVEGAVLAAGEFQIPVMLVGDKKVLEEELAKHETADLPVHLQHASQVVAMDEAPSQALRRKKDSSIRVAMQLVKNGEADAVFTAGHTGAALAAATLILRPLKGVLRPALAAVFPSLKGHCIVLDVGANVDCKAIQLFQFGIMGAVYAKYILGTMKPRVGLLSIGEEEGKGNETILEAFQMFKRSSLHFIGNVGGKDVFSGQADVIVCDGFAGNAALKFCEGLVDYYDALLGNLFGTPLRGGLATVLLKADLQRLKDKTDYTAMGGAALLGANGTCIIGHGSSSPRAVKSAICQAQRLVTQHINTHIQDDIELNQDIQESAQAKGRLWQSIKESFQRKGGPGEETPDDGET